MAGTGKFHLREDALLRAEDIVVEFPVGRSGAKVHAVSGVSIDQETVNMLQQQRSYQGAAMFISTVNQMMQSLLAITVA